MKRENFLRPITHAHHFGLMAAKAIQRELEKKPTEKQMEELREKALRFFDSDFVGHIGIEERMLEQLAFHAGPEDPMLDRSRREHRELRELLEKKDARSLELFADKLIRHIYFEEDELFREIEDEFTSAEKEWVETDLRFNVRDWPKITALAGKN